MPVTCKNTRNYVFSLPREKRVEKRVNFVQQISPGISILLPQQITCKKTPENKGENTPKTNSKRNRKMFSPPDETIPHSKRKIFFEINRFSTV